MENYQNCTGFIYTSIIMENEIKNPRFAQVENWITNQSDLIEYYNYELNNDKINFSFKLKPLQSIKKNAKLNVDLDLVLKDFDQDQLINKLVLILKGIEDLYLDRIWTQWLKQNVGEQNLHISINDWDRENDLKLMATTINLVTKDYQNYWGWKNYHIDEKTYQYVYDDFKNVPKINFINANKNHRLGK